MPSAQVVNSKDGATYTTSNGAAVAEPYAAQRIGTVGPLLLQGLYRSPLWIPHLTDCDIFRLPPH